MAAKDIVVYDSIGNQLGTLQATDTAVLSKLLDAQGGIKLGAITKTGWDTLATLGAEPANVNIQQHIVLPGNPHGSTAVQVGALDLASREAANGVAGLDANLEVIKPQAGAAAQVALGRTGARKRADGSWDGVNILLPSGYDLHLWADDLVSGQIYEVVNPFNSPSFGTWAIEVLRVSIEGAVNQYRTLRITALYGTSYPNGTIFTSTDVLGTWSVWEKFNIGGGSGWQPVTLLNGNTKNASSHLGIRKTPDGTVTVIGDVVTPVSGVLFNIPAGYIPNVMTPGATTMFAPAQADVGGLSYTSVSLNSQSFNMTPKVGAAWITINHSWQVI